MFEDDELKAMAALVIVCVVLFGTTVMFWVQSDHWKQTSIDLNNTCQQKLDYYRPYQNVVQAAYDCVENENCTSIVITPNRNETQAPAEQPSVV